MTRRRLLTALASVPLARAQELIGEPPGRIPPISELVNVFEVLAMARRKVPDHFYTMIAGGDRRALERITFRPRLMVNVSKLDLSTELLGETLAAPIIAGPISEQAAYHPEGEVATAQGASAAKAMMIVSGRSSKPLKEVVAASKTPLWFQDYPDPDVNVTIRAAQAGVDAGCKAVCLTVGVPYQSREARPESTGNLKLSWAAIDQVRKSVKAPLILKGLMSPQEAQTAVANGVQAIIVSNHGGMYTTGFADPIEMLPSVAEAIGGKIPILIDGSFRRGTDILKALALGARAVVVARPPVWGLAAYGAQGVQGVLEMLQSELARNMAMCGAPDVKAISPALVKVHRR